MTTVTQEKKKALGRGLESLIPAARSAAAAPALQPGEAVREISVEEIEPNPYQPRQHKDRQALDELAASIRESGVLQPILVRQIGRSDGHAQDGAGGKSIKYQVIAGERRWVASMIAGKETVPAIVRTLSNEQAMEVAIIENLQREDLNAMETAHAYERLSREFGLTQEQIAARTGKDRASVGNYVRLLRLPEQVQQMVEREELTFGHARALMALAVGAIPAAAKKVVEEAFSVRQTEDMVKELLAPHEAEKKSKANERPVDPNVRAAERQLQEALGTRVRILDRKGKGKVVIEYASLEDFDRIIEALSK